MLQNAAASPRKKPARIGLSASLVRVEYKEQAHNTDLQARRGKAFVVKKPEKPRGKVDRAYAGAAVRHEAEYYIPIEHHNPMELFASTAVWESDGKLTVYDKTQGVQNVQRYLCGVFKMKPDDMRVVVWQFNVNELDRVEGRPLHFPEVKNRWFYFDAETPTAGSA